MVERGPEVERHDFKGLGYASTEIVTSRTVHECASSLLLKNSNALPGNIYLSIARRSSAFHLDKDRLDPIMSIRPQPKQTSSDVRARGFATKVPDGVSSHTIGFAPRRS